MKNDLNYGFTLSNDTEDVYKEMKTDEALRAILPSFFKETEQSPLNIPRQQKNKNNDFTYDVLGDFYKEKETGHLNGFLSTIDNYNDPWEKERKLDSIRNVYYHPPYVSSDTTLLRNCFDFFRMNFEAVFV